MGLPFARGLPLYRKLDGGEPNEDSGRRPWRETRSKIRGAFSSPVFPWTLCAVLAFFLFFDSIKDFSQRISPYDSFAKGLQTELDVAKPSIRLQKVKFHGAFRLDPNGTYYLTTDPSAKKKYVGPPSEEIDEAWRGILRGRFVGLTPQEAATIGVDFVPDDFKRGRLYFEFSATHNLHCLNYLRKALDKDYYPDIDASRKPEVLWESSHRMHLDHCIEVLRQNIMCHVDMTPVPRTWVAPGDFWHADPDQTHMCRDFDSLHNWIKWRNRKWPEPHPTETD